jgi:hypothetical protein
MVQFFNYRRPVPARGRFAILPQGGCAANPAGKSRSEKGRILIPADLPKADIDL